MLDNNEEEISHWLFWCWHNKDNAKVTNRTSVAISSHMEIVSYKFTVLL